MLVQSPSTSLLSLHAYRLHHIPGPSLVLYAPAFAFGSKCVEVPDQVEFVLPPRTGRDRLAQLSALDCMHASPGLLPAP